MDFNGLYNYVVNGYKYKVGDEFYTIINHNKYMYRIVSKLHNEGNLILYRIDKFECVDGDTNFLFRGTIKEKLLNEFEKCGDYNGI